MGIGTNLKRLMAERDINANELAKAIGVTPSTIYSVLQRDSKKMSIDLIISIAHYLNVSADELLLSSEDYSSKVKPPIVRDSGSSYHKGPDLSSLALEVAAAFDDSDPVRQETVCDVLKIPYRKLKGREGGNIA